MCFSAPEQAGAVPAKSSTAISAEKPIVLAKFSKRRAQAAKKSRSARYARKTSTKVTVKKSEDTKPSKDAAITSKPELPSAVANAHAEAPKSRALEADEARNIAALDSTDISSIDGVQIAASDELNDVDRALTEETAPAPASTVAAQATPEPSPTSKVIKAMPTAERQIVKANDSDPWSKSSLIGKVFIAFGSLLTLASAARMLIA
jgi:hypothetical protein